MSTHARIRKSGLLRGALAALAFSALAGCAPSYGSIDFDAVSTPPVSVTVRSFLIDMPAGIAVVVRVKPISDNANDYDASYNVDLFSQDRDVLTVHRRNSRREFVLVGVNPGETCLEVEIDGRPEECIDVEITEPEGI
ncbi:MAG: hypothetical protein AAF721_05620 [Myxococcota bacterium]